MCCVCAHVHFCMYLVCVTRLFGSISAQFENLGELVKIPIFVG